ncbi:MAG: hypothetical protein HY594_00030 [Candidatus Omnitrophica bacterium]|nr:hypothetical protein [Candidatus Omnitrophota bacterium]
MSQTSKELLKTIAQLCRDNPRYSPEAYLFTLAALHFTVTSLPEPRHVTGPELLTGIRQYALEQFGGLTHTVFEHWGLKTTEDFGRIVFALVEAKVLSKTEQDRLGDFKDIYDFSQAFGPGSVSYQLADDLPDLPPGSNN